MIKIITLKTELPSGFLKYALAETDLGLELRVAEPLDRTGLDWQINCINKLGKKVRYKNVRKLK